MSRTARCAADPIEIALQVGDDGELIDVGTNTDNE